MSLALRVVALLALVGVPQVFSGEIDDESVPMHKLTKRWSRSLDASHDSSSSLPDQPINTNPPFSVVREIWSSVVKNCLEQGDCEKCAKTFHENAQSARSKLFDFVTPAVHELANKLESSKHDNDRQAGKKLQEFWNEKLHAKVEKSMSEASDSVGNKMKEACDRLHSTTRELKVSSTLVLDSSGVSDSTQEADGVGVFLGRLLVGKRDGTIIPQIAELPLSVVVKIEGGLVNHLLLLDSRDSSQNETDGKSVDTNGSTRSLVGKFWSALASGSCSNMQDVVSTTFQGVFQNFNFGKFLETNLLSFHNEELSPVTVLPNDPWLPSGKNDPLQIVTSNPTTTTSTNTSSINDDPVVITLEDIIKYIPLLGRFFGGNPKTPSVVDNYDSPLSVVESFCKRLNQDQLFRDVLSVQVSKLYVSTSLKQGVASVDFQRKLTSSDHKSLRHLRETNNKTILSYFELDVANSHLQRLINFVAWTHPPQDNAFVLFGQDSGTLAQYHLLGWATIVAALVASVSLGLVLRFLPIHSKLGLVKNSSQLALGSPVESSGSGQEAFYHLPADYNADRVGNGLVEGPLEIDQDLSRYSVLSGDPHFG